MEMGKLTAKLRDAVPVCFLVEGEEIKRYKNIEIPDELKKLEYQDFRFDVPLNGVITFKINFAPGVLPEILPEVRERRTRATKDAPAAVEKEMLTSGPVMVAIEITQESTATTALQDDQIEKIPDTYIQKVSEEKAGAVEVQTCEETAPEVIPAPAAQNATTAKKLTAKPKKAPAMSIKR